MDAISGSDAPVVFDSLLRFAVNPLLKYKDRLAEVAPEQLEPMLEYVVKYLQDEEEGPYIPPLDSTAERGNASRDSKIYKGGIPGKFTFLANARDVKDQKRKKAGLSTFKRTTFRCYIKF